MNDNTTEAAVEAEAPKTENVFEGKPDERQAGDIKPSRFRPKYRALNEGEVAIHNAIKETAAIMETLYDQLPDGRYKALGFTSLEESVMWAVKQLTA